LCQKNREQKRDLTKQGGVGENAFEIEELVQLDIQVNGRDGSRLVGIGTGVCEVGAFHVIGAVQGVRVRAEEWKAERLSCSTMAIKWLVAINLVSSIRMISSI